MYVVDPPDPSEVSGQSEGSLRSGLMQKCFIFRQQRRGRPISSALLALAGLFLGSLNFLACCLFASTKPVHPLPSKGLRMSILWDLGILAMWRLRAPSTGGGASLQAK